MSLGITSHTTMFIGLIFLLFEFNSIMQAVNIAFSSCDVILQKGYEGITTLEECESARASASNIVFFLFMSIAIPFIDVAMYFWIVNKFATPFITRKSTHLAIFIDTSEIVFKEIKEYKPFILYKNKLYWLGKGVYGKFDNIYHVFHINNNQELVYQERNIEKTKMLITASLNKKDAYIHKLKPTIKFLIPLKKEQLVRHWDIVIYKDYIDFVPSKQKGTKKIAVLKDANVYIVANETKKEEEIKNGEISLTSNSVLSLTSVHQLQQQQQQQDVHMIDLIDIEVKNNYNPALMYTIYRKCLEVNELPDLLVGSTKWIKWLIMGGILIVVVYLVLSFLAK
ncbi:MAG: hypothetical protein QXK74_07260 [Candidatus Nitrosocaldaceae archaeon]